VLHAAILSPSLTRSLGSVSMPHVPRESGDRLQKNGFAVAAGAVQEELRGLGR
jgi:hypothetical protein